MTWLLSEFLKMRGCVGVCVCVFVCLCVEYVAPFHFKGSNFNGMTEPMPLHTSAASNSRSERLGFVALVPLGGALAPTLSRT